MLSLRGDQNAESPAGRAGTPNARSSLKRNQFVIRMRCLGQFENPPTSAPSAGKPVLADLGPITFWVQNGQPRYIRWANDSTLVRHYFHLIDRVEIEFFYR